MKEPIKAVSMRALDASGLDANALELFARVVQAGSFAAAARKLGQTRAAVSRRIANLEQQVGHALLARSTRHLSLTEAGRRLAHSARAVLDATESARGVLRSTRAGLAGRVRITALASFGEAILAPLLAEFRRVHTGVTFELLFTNRRVDLLSEGVDVAFRITRKPPLDWVSRPILPFIVGAYAAPALCTAREHPNQLEAMPFLLLGTGRDTSVLNWLPKGGSSEAAPLEAQAAAFSEDLSSLITLARAGTGVVLAPDYCVARDLAAGTLIDVLPDWHLPIAEGDTVHALTLPWTHTGLATRELVNFVAQGCERRG